LADGTEAAADLYAYVAGKLGITPAFDSVAPISPGVMLYPVMLQDSVLYVMASESTEDATIDVHDKLTGVRLTLVLPGQHAALALIGKQEKRVIAKYGF